MSQKILVPGAGYGQVPVIKKAKEMGLTAIVVSIKGDYPGFQYADKIYYEDSRDKEKVLEIAIKESIDGIISDQNDIPMQTIGYVSEKLNLPGNNYETSCLFTDKYLMRKKCQELCISSIQFDIASSLEEAKAAADKLGYPLMCKPIDNQSSKGVSKLENTSQLTEKVERAFACSFSGKLILEQFIEGDEYCVEGLAIDYNYKNLLLLDRTYFKHSSYFIPASVSSPSNLPEHLKTELLELNKKVATAFGIRQGLTHGEYIYSNRDQKFYLVEIAARGGGVFISSHLVPYACGFETDRLLVDLAVGNPLSIDDFNYAEKAVKYSCFYMEEGEIVKVDGIDKINHLNNVLYFHNENIAEGNYYSGLVDKSSRLGPVLFGGETTEDVLEAETKVKELLIIRNSSNSSIYWE